jgi:hypothetical protein
LEYASSSLAGDTNFRDEAMQPREPRKSGRSLWADLNIDLSAEVSDEARREMWKDFRQG